jgi:hypothetical protein
VIVQATQACVLCRRFPRPGRPVKPVKPVGTPAIPAHAACYRVARRACGAWQHGRHKAPHLRRWYR